MSGSDAPEETQANVRPAEVIALLYQGTSYDTWRFHNKDKNRFFILNLEKVLELLDVQHTKMEAYFRKAETEIRASAWAKQYQSKWECSHTQLKPKVRRAPKTFSRAVIIIVALEMCAREVKPDVNVYDYLRVLPAFYFVDSFDEARLEAFETHFAALDADAKKIWLGGQGDGFKTFADACHELIEQNFGGRLLHQLAAGFCVSQFAAEKARAVLNHAAVPAELRVGPVLRAGEESRIDQVAFPRKAAADHLRVLRRREPAELIAETGYLK